MLEKYFRAVYCPFALSVELLSMGNSNYEGVALSKSASSMIVANSDLFIRLNCYSA
jgi:hypothetical protein